MRPCLYLSRADLSDWRARVRDCLKKLPQTRFEVIMRWLDEVVVPGRVVGVGRSGRRLVFVTRGAATGVIGVREDGRSATPRARTHRQSLRDRLCA